jgi:hypothetical protein
MKRVLVFAAAIGLILPAAANAGAFQGVVIAKNAKRKAIVVAAANGNVRTARAPKSFRKIGLGGLVTVRAAQLPDGTFAATAVKQLRRAKHVRVRATVVKRAGRRLYLSGGKSVFALALRKGAGAKLHAGDRVNASASFGKAQLFCDDVKPIGHDGQLELEGIYLSTDADVLGLAVHGRGLVKVAVPEGFELPRLSPGDEVALVVTVEPDGSFTLVSLDNEDAGDESDTGDDGVDMSDNWFTVTGMLSSLSSGSVAVDVERHPEPVRCSVRPGTNLSGFAVGQLVEMGCKFVDGNFVLVKLRSKTAELPGDGGGSLEVKGFISDLSATAVTVRMPTPTVASISHEGGSVSCGLKPGQDLRGFAVGDFVEMECANTGSGLYVKSISSDSASWPEDGMPSFTVDGILTSIRSDGVGVQVEGHPSLVNCAMPAGTNLSGFGLGDTVEMQCNYHDGKFNLALLSSDSAQLTLE